MRAVLALVVLLSACPATTTAPQTGSETKPAAPSQKKTQKGAVPPPLDLDRAVVVVDSVNGPQRFKVQVAKTNKERERGLMYREALADDEGMIFLFERQEPRSFWMKNTWIPLDMLFIDEDHVVQGIVENAEPLTTSSRRIEAPTKFVLEVRGGLTRKLGITKGAKVTWEGAPQPLWQKSVEETLESP